MSTTEQPLQEGAAADAAPGVKSGPIVVGAIMVAAGAFLLREAVLAVDSDGVLIGGPQLAPIIVSAGWLTFALLYLVTAVLHRRHEAPPDRRRRRHRRSAAVAHAVHIGRCTRGVRPRP